MFLQIGYMYQRQVSVHIKININILVYLNGKNAAEGEDSDMKYANSNLIFLEWGRN